VHANQSALTCAVGDARQKYPGGEPSEIWFLGDAFGRGPEPVATWRQLTAYGLNAQVAGNHDWGVGGLSQNILIDEGLQDGLFNADDWQVILDHRGRLASVGLLTANGGEAPRGGDVLTWIRSLPVVCVPRRGIYLV